MFFILFAIFIFPILYIICNTIAVDLFCSLCMNVHLLCTYTIYCIHTVLVILLYINYIFICLLTLDSLSSNNMSTLVVRQTIVSFSPLDLHRCLAAARTAGCTDYWGMIKQSSIITVILSFIQTQPPSLPLQPL